MLQPLTEAIDLARDQEKLYIKLNGRSTSDLMGEVLSLDTMPKFGRHSLGLSSFCEKGGHPSCRSFPSSGRKAFA
jgi:hypothetical protein